MFDLPGMFALLTASGKTADGFKGKWFGMPCDVVTFAAKPIGTEKIKLQIKLRTGAGVVHTLDAVYDTTSGQPDRDVIKLDGADVDHEDISFAFGVKGQLFPPKIVPWAKIKCYWGSSPISRCEVEYQKGLP